MERLRLHSQVVAIAQANTIPSGSSPMKLDSPFIFDARAHKCSFSGRLSRSLVLVFKHGGFVEMFIVSGFPFRCESPNT
jgi:hypothetical protein